MKAREDTKEKPEISLLKFRELFDRCRKAAVPTHPAELAKRRAKVLFLTSDLELERLELLTLPGFVEEASQLRENVKNDSTKVSEFDSP